MRNNWIKQLVVVPIFLALSACPASNNEIASAADAAPATIEIAQIPEDPDPAIWVIKDEDTTIYLFGTVHILKPGLSWFDEAVKDAFDASDELVVEMIDPDPAEMVKIVNELAIDQTGKSVRDKLQAEDREKYEAALMKLGLPVASFDPLELWFASVNISLVPLMANGYDSASGVEKDLTALAKSREMKIVGLETPRQQLGFFDNLPEDAQIRFLNFTIETVDEMVDGMNNMVARWALADTDALAELMNAGLEDKILYDTLLANRNANWAEWVEDRMSKPGTVFLAVGAGHLAGESSLQELLSEKGLNAEQIEY
ncbi:MAG: TraB/GumN family protein [Parasphingorhabdus sp.]